MLHDSLAVHLGEHLSRDMDGSKVLVSDAGMAAIGIVAARTAQQRDNEIELNLHMKN